MTWSVRALQNDPLVLELVNEGFISDADGEEILTAAALLTNTDGPIRILNDATQLVHPPGSTEITGFADYLVSLGMVGRLRHASVRPTDVRAAMWVDHWVAAASNRGLVVDAFRTREEALSWLMG